MVATELLCGVVAGPVFVVSFTAIGARRAGYDWRRHAVSSLADGRGGWLQRANFVLTGTLYGTAACGLARSPKETAGPRVVPALILGVGGGLVGSGLFVTDPVAGFPPSSPDRDVAHRTRSVAPTREGRLHNLLAIPIFLGIPMAALTCAAYAAHRKQYRWAAYSASSAVAMTAASALFGAAFGGAPRLVGRGGRWRSRRNLDYREISVFCVREASIRAQACSSATISGIRRVCRASRRTARRRCLASATRSLTSSGPALRRSASA